MGWWQISTDALAGSRFVISPLAETTATLFALERGAPAHPGEREWFEAHGPAYRARLAADPRAAELVRAARGNGWNADFLTPTPGADPAPVPEGDGTAEFTRELERIRETPPESVRADLAVAQGRQVPDRLTRHDPAGRVADLVEWVWTETVLPYWPARRRICEADVVARTRQLTLGGWAAALEAMRPRMRWLGEGRLQINTRDYPPREVGDARLVFVPVTPRSGWVCWEERPPYRYGLVYPCTGPAVAPDGAAEPGALGRLLGTHRARVLLLLDTPKSTTQLVGLTGMALGSVGRHLKVLLDARLVVRQRAGRSVLYCRTAAGDGLVAAQSEE
ncbi:ArsR/SmtB family transcription factor [Streptomyces liangshanensis]|uniref:Winged helix-turn-helix transcriptional regulator n=1 Tax=Streptomyces liangshanensis TaxID=2717324 RepID=A0A6G9GRW1_9ACTN|nr:winged helix-turn-helix domain-containing protein [Streptomyces liangshanensis]QIQ00982.1 winged helix-turn-helix transcriptional regulator [Streptomyces liangshanensis]